MKKEIKIEHVVMVETMCYFFGKKECVKNGKEMWEQLFGQSYED